MKLSALSLGLLLLSQSAFAVDPVSELDPLKYIGRWYQ
jgi:hypothetical protein